MENASTIVGHSATVKELQRLIVLFAGSSATVLIQGESGTGKELVARSLHFSSPRRRNTLVPVNCAAIPRDLLESELFGHRKGAFSGAIADRMGRFQLADGGTIFLDEVGDMSLDLQSKMLRVLQEGVIDPVGSTQQVQIDVRVVAATHRDLEAECAAGRFREDLYYRLNVLPITVPPLRERAEDIATLVSHFAARHSLPGMLPSSFDQELMGLLKGYSWPGNIRELSNLVHRLCVLYPSKTVNCREVPLQMFPKKLRDMIPTAAPVLMADVGLRAVTTPEKATVAQLRPMLPERNDFFQGPGSMVGAGMENPEIRPMLPERSDYVQGAAPVVGAGMLNPVEEIILIANGQRDFPVGGVALKKHLSDLERKIITHALSHADGNVSRTAQLLSLQRTTLIQKMNKLREDGFDEFDELRSLSSSATSIAAQ